MVQDTCKNDVKAVFLIANSISVVGLGLLVFSIGVGSGVYKGKNAVDILSIILGLSYIVVGFLGYWGATAGNKKILSTYTTVLCVMSISNVIRLVMWTNPNQLETGPGASPAELMAAMIFVTVLTMLTMLLSFTLSVYAAKEAILARPAIPRPAAQTVQNVYTTT